MTNTVSYGEHHCFVRYKIYTINNTIRLKLLLNSFKRIKRFKNLSEIYFKIFTKYSPLLDSEFEKTIVFHSYFLEISKNFLIFTKSFNTFGECLYILGFLKFCDFFTFFNFPNFCRMP